MDATAVGIGSEVLVAIKLIRALVIGKPAGGMDELLQYARLEHLIQAVGRHGEIFGQATIEIA